MSFNLAAGRRCYCLVYDALYNLNIVYFDINSKYIKHAIDRVDHDSETGLISNEAIADTLEEFAFIGNLQWIPRVFRRNPGFVEDPRQII